MPGRGPLAPPPSSLYPSIKQAAGPHQAALKIAFFQGGDAHAAAAGCGVNESPPTDIDAYVIDGFSAASGEEEEIARLKVIPCYPLSNTPLFATAARQLDAKGSKDMLHQARTIKAMPALAACNIGSPNISQRLIPQGMAQRHGIIEVPKASMPGGLAHQGPWQRSQQDQDS